MPVPAPAFALEDACASYVPGAPVLDHADAAFAPGRVHVLTGPSGVGKTTLLRLLMGLAEPDSGRVARPPRARLAAAFQEDRLVEGMTPTANIRLPRGRLRGPELDAFLAREREALAAVGLPELACGPAAARPVRELSGGQRRRVAVLRALLADADALFFDEALRGLDARTASRVLDFALPLLAGKTVFWVTHDPSEADRFPDCARWRICAGKLERIGAQNS